MKKTIYELLGLIKDGKAPKKIKYINLIWEYDKETKDYFNDDLWLIYSMNSIGLTEREVEIIEEEKKIPEKLEDYDFDNGLDANTKCECLRERMQEIENQLDEIIDYLKSKGE